MGLDPTATLQDTPPQPLTLWMLLWKLTPWHQMGGMGEGGNGHRASIR